MNDNRRLNLPKSHLRERGVSLAWWLNKGKDQGGAKERIVAILEQLWECERIVRTYRGTPQWKVPGAYDLEKRLDAMTERYKKRLRFAFAGDVTYLTVAHVWIGGAGIEEGNALQIMEILVQADMLNRLIKCANCKKNWLFKRKNDHIHCSKSCRQEVYERTPHRKELKAKRNQASYRHWIKGSRKKRRKQ